MEQDTERRVSNETNRAGDDGRAAELDNEFQADPQLTEGPVSRGRIWSYGAVIVVILCAVFYGLHSASRQASNPSPAVTQSEPSPPHAAGNTANPNHQPGVTTGSAPSRPTTPQPGPTGTEANPMTKPPFVGESK
jgi:hypothetical protein